MVRTGRGLRGQVGWYDQLERCGGIGWTMKASDLAAVVIAFSVLGRAASAQSMQGMQMPAPPTEEPASTKAYRSAMSKMGQSMAVTYSGNADKDFVAGMIPHHDGAVEMAKVELQYGKDPQ